MTDLSNEYRAQNKEQRRDQFGHYADAEEKVAFPMILCAVVAASPNTTKWERMDVDSGNRKMKIR